MEDIEEQSTGEFNLQHYLGIVRRRHLHFLIPLLLGWLLVWGSSWVLPARYKSGTLILVEQPTMPKDYVTPNVSDDLQERLQSITQQILSRTNLLRIIDQFHLYSGPTNERSADDKVDAMRKDVEIELVHDTRNEITAFNVYYSSPDPHIAQQVTSEITNLFIGENLQARQEQSEGTTKFLEDQLESARGTLSDQEEKIREFKAQHVGELPSQLSSNLEILSGLQSQLQAEQDALSTAKQQHVYFETLLTQYRSLQSSPRTSDASPVGLPAIDQQLDKLRAQLADLRSHYTDKHPDVRKVKDEIAQTEKMRVQLLGNLKASNAHPTTDPAATASDAGDAQSAPIAQLQSQMKANQIEISNRESAVEGLKAKIADYQGRLNAEPVREQQLADLTRGYDQSKANYDDLLKKKNESAMATSMELLQQGERFQILDPPSFPTRPDFPNRLKFCGIGLGVGLALGIMVTGAFEVLDDRVYDEKELKDLLPVTIIAEIPDVAGASEESKHRKRTVLGWVTAGVVFAIILLGSAVSYIRG